MDTLLKSKVSGAATAAAEPAIFGSHQFASATASDGEAYQVQRAFPTCMAVLVARWLSVKAGRPNFCPPRMGGMLI